jgi:hypothetical protein
MVSAYSGIQLIDILHAPGRARNLAEHTPGFRDLAKQAG